MDDRRWYRLELSPEDCVKDGKADQLQKAFEVMYISMHKPASAALFEWFDERAERNILYLSPLAAALVYPLIEHTGAVECTPPLTCDRLVLLAGDLRAAAGLERGVGDRT